MRVCVDPRLELLDRVAVFVTVAAAELVEVCEAAAVLVPEPVSEPVGERVAGFVAVGVLVAVLPAVKLAVAVSAAVTVGVPVRVPVTVTVGAFEGVAAMECEEPVV